MFRSKLIVYLYLFGLWSSASRAAEVFLTPNQEKILKAADTLMNEYEISYVYGGHQVGDTGTCQSCNQCLESKTPTPPQRLILCPECQKCSIDCSHFTQLAFANAGFPIPYLPTEAMLELSKTKLNQSYKLVDMGTNDHFAEPGDLLVYKGHVVLLEKNYFDGHGDIIHATSGSEIRIPGQGIQRKRRTPIANLRGPLLRILRLQMLLNGRQLKKVQ
jgi:cell wall-associated NlpC family hydrolase